MSHASYTLHIPRECENKTDTVLEAWLDVHPHHTVDDAISAIFQIGVNVQRALGEDETRL
jgi:hypothetical protein